MAEEITNDNTESEEQSKNDVESTGADTTDNSKDKSQEEKKLTQSEVNEIVKRAKADAERAAKSKFEKGLEGKSVLTEDDVNKLRKDIETEVRTKIAMENKRAEYKAKGLSDVQLDTVQVEDIKDYDKRVNELFGVLLTKDAPVLNGGKNNDESNGSSSFLQRQQAKLQKMKKENYLK